MHEGERQRIGGGGKGGGRKERRKGGRGKSQHGRKRGRKEKLTKGERGHDRADTGMLVSTGDSKTKMVRERTYGRRGKPPKELKG